MKAPAMMNPAVKPTSMSPFATLLWAKLRISRHTIASVRRQSKLKVAFVSVGAVALWLLIFAASALGFRLFEIFGAEILEGSRLSVADLLMSRLISVFALTLFVLLIFSNVLVAYATFYRAREVPALILAPLPFPAFFLARFAECLSFSSWASAYLGSPVMLAYGLMSGAPVAFYPLLVAFYVPFIVIPAALGTLLAMALVRLLAHLRRGAWVGLGLLLLAGLFTFFRGKVQAPSLAEASTFQAILEVMGRSQSVFLPSHWMSRGVLSAALGDVGEAIFFFLLLLANALFVLWLVTILAEKLFYPGWSDLEAGDEQAARSVAKGPLRHLDRLLRILPQPTRALMVKDMKLFWRDPAQWAQFVLFFGLMALYVANLGSARSFARQETWSAWATLLNLAACMLILASLTTRFVYPLISLEGPRIWILGLAPVGMRRIVMQKFWLSVGTTSIFTVTVATLSAIRLELDPIAFSLSLLAIIATTVALSGLSVGLGSLYPDFEEDNPSRVVSGMGGTLNFLLSMVYVVLVTIALALVLLWDSSWTGWLGDKNRLTLLATAWILAVTAITCWLPLRLGLKNLERVEF